MKRKIKVFIVIVWLIPNTTFSQKAITLKECYEQAITSNKLAGEKDAYSNISGIKDENLFKGWLPTLDANGSFVYNSSVVDIGSSLGALPIPGISSAIKPLPHEQYRVTVDINQMIYDGGAIKGARAVEKTDMILNQKQTETDLYKLRGQINGYFFNILLLNRQKELLDNYLEVIRKRISSMQSAANNGVIIKSDIDVMTSEKIRVEQQLEENEIRKASLFKVLSDITGKIIDPNSELIIPAETEKSGDEITRPELQLFDLRKEQLSASIRLIDSKRMPKAFGFATLGYGNPPGNNFFKDEFAPYYILGAGVKWNIFDWNKAKNERKLVTLQQGILDNRKNDLTDNLKRMMETKLAEIRSLEKLLTSDNELIILRKRITASAESQYENGTITATEYLNELNSEKQAVINYELHKVNLSMARIEYMNISGKEIR